LGRFTFSGCATRWAERQGDHTRGRRSEELLRGRGLFSRSGRPRPDASEKLERPWPRTGARPRAPSTAVESVPAPGEVFAQLPPTGSPEAEHAPRRSPFEGNGEEVP